MAILKASRRDGRFFGSRRIYSSEFHAEHRDAESVVKSTPETGGNRRRRLRDHSFALTAFKEERPCRSNRSQQQLAFWLLHLRSARHLLKPPGVTTQSVRKPAPAPPRRRSNCSACRKSVSNGGQNRAQTLLPVLASVGRCARHRRSIKPEQDGIDLNPQSAWNAGHSPAIHRSETFRLPIRAPVMWRPYDPPVTPILRFLVSHSPKLIPRIQS